MCICVVLSMSVHNMLTDAGYVTSGQNPAKSELYEYTIYVCSNSSDACIGDTTAEAAACQRDTGNNQSFVLGRLNQQILR